LLICSDGLTTELADEEIRDAILTSEDLALASERLVDLANAHGGHDNTTVLLVGASGDLPPPAHKEPIEKTYRVLETFEP
jgi:protein phosphatase